MIVWARKKRGGTATRNSGSGGSTISLCASEKGIHVFSRTSNEKKQGTLHNHVKRGKQGYREKRKEKLGEKTKEGPALAA